MNKIEWLKSELDECGKLDGDEKHESMALIMNQLGAAYASDSDFTRSLEFYEKALAAGKNQETSTIYAQTLLNIAGVHQQRNLVSLASDFYSQAIGSFVKCVGHLHPGGSLDHQVFSFFLHELLLRVIQIL
jgi:tetratricopeptide (TPR) repeat protein